MLTTGANKARKAATSPTRTMPTIAAGRCPQCGRTDTACRTVPHGFWCQRDGLTEDPSTWIIPEPDPISVAVHQDPAVVEAQTLVEVRLAEAEVAHTRWLNALRAHTTHALKSGVMVNDHGLFRHTGRDDRKLDKLAQQVEEARTDLDEATTRTSRARKVHAEAVDQARLREINKERERVSR